MTYTNYDWFIEHDFSRYSGEWLVIIDKRLVAHGNDVNKILKEAKKKHPNKMPFVTKIRSKLSNNMLTALASEKVLAKDWLTKEEDERWKHLQKEM